MDSKVLVAITSCHPHRSWQQSQRDTWLPELGCDYRYFLGNPEAEAAPDEVFLNVPDDYHSLFHKTVGLVRWALVRGYDYVYKCDVDTLVNPSNLLSSGFEQHDYIGGLNGHFASGGSGYWLSHKAMEIVAVSTIKDGSTEDVYVADLVWREHGLELHADERYAYYPGTELTKDTISYHISSCNGWPGEVAPYEPSMMHAAHERLKIICKSDSMVG